MLTKGREVGSGRRVALVRDGPFAPLDCMPVACVKMLSLLSMLKLKAHRCRTPVEVLYHWTIGCSRELELLSPICLVLSAVLD